MNYFAHGRDAIDDPYFLAGTAVPDWLGVVDRRMRVRSKAARPFIKDDDPHVAALARGIVRHHRDDDRFHQTASFAELSWQFTTTVRDVLPRDDGLRPSFLGHILVELLLDAELILEDPDRLDAYYRVLDSLDPVVIQDGVNRMAGRPTERLASFIPRFSAERFLYDYVEDAKLLSRLNQVMRRVRLPLLPGQFCRILPEARRQVGLRKVELLGI